MLAFNLRVLLLPALLLLCICMSGCVIVILPRTTVWKNGDPLKKTLTITNAGPAATWRGAFILQPATFFKPGATNCPAPGAMFAAGAKCTADAEINAWALGHHGFFIVEVEVGGKRTIYPVTLETK